MSAASSTPRIDATKAVTLTMTAAEATELAGSLMDQDKFAFAHRILQAALEAYPREVFLLIDAGSCLIELRRGPEAISLLKEAAELDPTGNASIELGWAATIFHDHQTAKDAIVTALQRRPENLTEIYCDAPMWAGIRYDLDVMRAIEAAEGKLQRKEAPAKKRPSKHGLPPKRKSKI